MQTGNIEFSFVKIVITINHKIPYAESFQFVCGNEFHVLFHLPIAHLIVSVYFKFFAVFFFDLNDIEYRGLYGKNLNYSRDWDVLKIQDFEPNF